MVDLRLKNLRGDSRRRFLKFSAAAGAVLALDQTEVLNVVADSAGTAMADEQGCTSTTNRSIHLVGGNGGFAWFQLLWPHNAVAAAENDTLAFHAPGQSVMAGDTDNPLTHAPQTPWTSLDKTKRMGAFMAGNNETHTAQPTSAATLGGGISMLAAAASLQNQLPSLLPVIGVTPFNFGTAPGAPQVTSVGSPQGMVELFNSAASQALLSINSDANLYEAYYKAFLSLSRAAGRPTWQRQLRITKASANFLGKNLANLLTPTEADLNRYGITPGGSPEKLEMIARTLITATKAFKNGLTNSVVLPVMRDDPHGAFNNMGTLTSTVETLGRILDATMEDLMATSDPVCSNKTLADTTVITIHGDTPKTPLNRNAWPDGTPGNSNWIYLYSAGLAKTGWFGGINLNTVDGFDPSTGNTLPGAGSGNTANAAGAAVCYAIAQGDMARVQEFYSGPSIAGIVNEQIL